MSHHGMNAIGIDTDLRHLWNVSPDLLYFNHGAFGLPPNVVHETQVQLQQACNGNPMDFYLRQLEPGWYGAREKLASFLGTDAANLAFCTCATTGMNHIASFFPLREGEEVLVNSHEYGAVKKIWQRRCRQTGASFREIAWSMPLRDSQEVIDLYRKELRPNTRIAILSHITSPTAITLPIAELTQMLKANGTVVCIDGPHAILQLPLNLEQLGCDFYTASCHKWLAAPLGSGFTYIAPQWHSIAEPFEISWGRLPPGELRSWSDHQVWVGTRDYSPYLSIPRAIDFFTELGIDWIRERNHELARYARGALIESLGTAALVADENLGSSQSLYAWMTAAYLPEGDWSQLQLALWTKHKIEIPVIFFEGRYHIRVSCHLYHSTSDIDRLVKAISTEVRRK